MNRTYILTRLFRRYRTDVDFRIQLTLWPGAFLNAGNVALHLLSGTLSRSSWFYALALYYALLAGLRFYLLGHIRRKPMGQELFMELKKTRLCGWLRLLLCHSLTVIVYHMVRRDRGFRYPGLLVFAMAAYGVGAFIVAIVSLIRYRHRGSPVLLAIKTLSLVNALTAILSAETALLSRFGTALPLPTRRFMLAMTGTGVCLAVMALAIAMILRAHRALQTHQQRLSHEPSP